MSINHSTYQPQATSAPRFLVAGGGTGGHIFPAIAIAQAILEHRPDAQFHFVGAQGKMEMEKIPQAGFTITGLPMAGFNRSAWWKNISLPLKLIQSFWQVRQLFRRFQPTAVIGVGGYSSFPVLRWAQARRIPTFIHESNSFAGKSNQLLGKQATRVYVASTGMEVFFPADRIRITGNPVRKALFASIPTKAQACVAFQLDPTKPVLLVVGGSLGARSMNTAVDAGLDAFLDAGVQVIWQTGQGYTEQAATRVQGKVGVWTSAFISNMQDAYAAADVVVSRSGAMAVAEICVMRKPVIFVPFPFAAEDHQTVNAKQLEQQGAAEWIADKEVATQFVPAALHLLQDAERRAALVSAITPLGITDADQRIATDILQTLKLA